MKFLINRLLYLIVLTPILMYGQVGVGIKIPQGILHIDAAKDNPTVGEPSEAHVSNDIIVTKGEGKVGLGTLTPITKVDLRNQGDGALAIGNTTLSATQAGTGAIRYSLGELEYSNGQRWVKLVDNTVVKAVVVAVKETQSVNCYAQGGVSPGNYAGIPQRTPCYLTNWTTKLDNLNTFSTTGVFTAPEDGIYTATFTFALEKGVIAANSLDENQVEAIWRLRNNSGVEINSVKSANTYAADGNVAVGSSCTASFYMEAGQTIRPEVWIDLRFPASHRKEFITTGGYNSLTIIQQ